MNEKRETKKNKNSKIWWRKKQNGEIDLSPAGKFELLLSLVSFQIRDDYDIEFLKLLRFMHYNYNVPLKESLLYGINPEKEELDFDIISTNKHYIELFFNVILSQAGSDQFGRFRPKDVTPSKLLDYFLSQELAFDENQKLPNTLKDINVLLRKKLAYQDIDFFDEVKLGHALTPNEMSKVLKKI